MSMYGRAHSGNVNALSNAIHRWNAVDYSVVLQEYYSPMPNKMHCWVAIRKRGTEELFAQVDLSDSSENIRDEDVRVVMMTTWINKQFNDYMSWQ